MNNMNQMNGNGFNQQPDNNNEQKFFLNFQPNDILQKEFKTKMRGYDQSEVDQYLDGIIKDYESYDNELNRLKAENNRLQSQLNSLAQNQPAGQQKPASAARRSNRIPVQPQQPKANPMGNFNNNTNANLNNNKADASTNYDILRRISNLEKHVFGRDFANGIPDQNDTARKNDSVKQFASAAMPNHLNTNNNQNNPFESGHNEINTNNVGSMNQNTANQNPNLSPDHFDANRQDMNGFRPNLNNNGNMGQF